MRPAIRTGSYGQAQIEGNNAYVAADWYHESHHVARVVRSERNTSIQFASSLAFCCLHYFMRLGLTMWGVERRRALWPAAGARVVPE